MPTTCAVVGCHNRQCEQSFYRFPKDKDRRRLWIAFVSRRNPDGSPWQPGSGDRVCSDHFVSRKKSELPSSPDFVPSVRSVESDLPGCPIRGEDSYRRFERARNRARLQEQHSKAVEKNRQEVELEQIRQKGIQRAITHDHTYANNEGEPVSLEEPLSEGSAIRDECSDLNDERLNEDEELNRELLSNRDDTGIPVEVGKAQFGKEIHA